MKHNNHATDRRDPNESPFKAASRKKKGIITHSQTTPGQWAIEEDSIVYRHWQYSGWPNFGRILVASVDSSWPQGEERHANKQLIVTACNACREVNPSNPIAAAHGYVRLVRAVRMLALEAWRYDEEARKDNAPYHVPAETLEVIRELLVMLGGKETE